MRTPSPLLLAAVQLWIVEPAPRLNPIPFAAVALAAVEVFPEEVQWVTVQLFRAPIPAEMVSVLILLRAEQFVIEEPSPITMP